MAGEAEYDEANTADEGGMTGPGAPTPLSALEVRSELSILEHWLHKLTLYSGCCRTDET